MNLQQLLVPPDLRVVVIRDPAILRMIEAQKAYLEDVKARIDKLKADVTESNSALVRAVAEKCGVDPDAAAGIDHEYMGDCGLAFLKYDRNLQMAQELPQPPGSESSPARLN